MPAAAIVGAAAIGGVATTVAGNKAAKAQKNAAAQQIAESRRQYDQTRADYAPAREAGAGATNKLASMYGVYKPGDASYVATDFTASPGYDWRLSEGVKAAERSAASRGLLGSGAAVKAIQRYGEGLASSEYENYANSLKSLAGLGQNATTGTAAAGAQSTGQINNAYQQAGNARASSYANTGSAINGTVNNLASLYLYQQGGGFGVPKTTAATPGYGS